MWARSGCNQEGCRGLHQLIVSKIFAIIIIWIDAALIILEVTSRSLLNPSCLERWLSAAALTIIYSLTAEGGVEGCGRLAQNSRGSWRLCLIISHYLLWQEHFCFFCKRQAYNGICILCTSKRGPWIYPGVWESRDVWNLSFPLFQTSRRVLEEQSALSFVQVCTITWQLKSLPQDYFSNTFYPHWTALKKKKSLCNPLSHVSDVNMHL